MQASVPPIPTLDDIVRLYPLLYTQKRLRDWFQLFDERAVAIRVASATTTSFQDIRAALPEQEEYQSENDTMVETWESVEIYQYGSLATIKADYVLVADRETRKGVDLLTLTNGTRGWRIVSLAYEQTELIPG